MAIHGWRWTTALFVTVIGLLLIAPNAARSAPVRAINASAIAETSLVEKSVIINRTPRRYSCWWQRTRLGIPRRICNTRRPLADGQPDLRPVFNRRRKYVVRLVEIVAGIQHAIDLRAIACPFLDLVEVALIRNQPSCSMMASSPRCVIR
jgi:hypothetical protein